MILNYVLFFVAVQKKVPERMQACTVTCGCVPEAVLRPDRTLRHR